MTETPTQHDARLGLDEAPVAHLAQWLVSNLGPRLTAFAVDSPAVDEIAGGRAPDEPTERRVRNLYAVAWLLSVEDGPGSAHAWLVEANPDLGHRCPAQVLHDGGDVESVWLAAAPVY